MSDHGSSLGGAHGGNTYAEMNSILFFYHKRGFDSNLNFSPFADQLLNQPPPFYIPKDKANDTGSNENIHRNIFEIDAQPQIDIAVTLCWLFGLPPPFSSFGTFIPDVLIETEPKRTPSTVLDKFLRDLYVNA